MKHFRKLLFLICFMPIDSTYADETPTTLTEVFTFTHYDQLAQQAKNDESHYLNTLIKEANRQKLYKSEKWRMLIHYRNNFLGGYTSEVDGEDFFMSKTGKNNPEAELESTLASFFSNQADSYTKLTPQCRFIARFHWLNQQLSFDPDKLPVQNCHKFTDFKRGVDAASITIIFPSAHPDGPASMFGHTSLKIDKKSQTPQTRMLDYTLNFAANAGPDRGIMYAIKGLTGEFQGQYNILPYYNKIREYAQMESRDIWEYKLNLSQQQVDFVVMHAYELSPTYFDYYFFTENCSYHLLTLIESSLDKPILTNDFNAWVIPVDTLKTIDKNNLLESVEYLPSLSTKIHQRRKQLSENENLLVFDLFENGLVTQKLEHLSIERQAMVLDLLYDYMRYRKIDENNRLDTTITEDERLVLLTRSKLHIASKPVYVPKPETRPDQGHDTSRFSMENIKPDGNESFQRVSWRVAYHGLLDPTPGYSPNYQLEFFNIKFSNEENSNNYKFDQLEILNIISLAPRDSLFKKISWRIKTGFDRLLRASNDSDTIYYLDGGVGLTYQKSWFKQSYVYGFLDTELDFGDNRFNKTIASVGPSIGLLTDISKIWKAQFEARSYVQNDPAHTQFNEILFKLNVALDKNASLRFELKKMTNDKGRSNDDKITFSLNIFH